MKSFSTIDLVLAEIEHSLRCCHVKPPINKQRPYPANKLDCDITDELQRKHVAGLMRVNNAGEVAAQGLYRGQAVFARNDNIKKEMQVAANEENEHLNWCQTRLEELGSKRSLLDPFWYWGSFTIGLTAGLAGDKWSMGFVEETEKKVSQHLDRHIERLPQQDERSKAILQTMQQDELRHAETAHKSGAAPLPRVIRRTMDMVSKVMTMSAYRI